MITPEQFSRHAMTDLETAISLAVARTLSVPFPGPGGVGKIAFTQIFEDWPSFESEYTDPSGVILPDEPLVYGPSHLVPHLLEDTWEPVGEPGLGLYELCEASRDLGFQYRSGSAAERNALKAGIETAFVVPEVTLAPVAGERYGILATMPEYWGLTVRLAIADSIKLDDADSAAKNIWEGRATIRAQAKLVKLAVVQPFRVRIKEVISAAPIPRPVP
jgi:hypothetical protein